MATFDNLFNKTSKTSLSDLDVFPLQGTDAKWYKVTWSVMKNLFVLLAEDNVFTGSNTFESETIATDLETTGTLKASGETTVQTPTNSNNPETKGRLDAVKGAGYGGTTLETLEDKTQNLNGSGIIDASSVYDSLFEDDQEAINDSVSTTLTSLNNKTQKLAIDGSITTQITAGSAATIGSNELVRQRELEEVIVKDQQVDGLILNYTTLQNYLTAQSPTDLDHLNSGDKIVSRVNWNGSTYDSLDAWIYCGYDVYDAKNWKQL